MSKDAYYFSHDANAQDDEKILDLRADYGWEGYGLFWAVIEEIAMAYDGIINGMHYKNLIYYLVEILSNESLNNRIYTTKELMDECKYELEEKKYAKKFIDYLIKINLLDKKDDLVYCSDYLGEPKEVKQNQKLRKSKQYKNWRRNVFERDNYQCQKCGQTGGQLNAHHIKPYSEFPSLRLELDNGVTLCEKCHKKEHWGD